MKKKKETKLVTFVLFLIILFFIFIYFTFKPYDYKQEYYINEYKVVEEFSKKENYYTFIISNDNAKFAYVIKSKYFRKRKIIDDIIISSNQEELCILPVSSKIEFYPLCDNDSKIYTYNLAHKNDIKFEYIKIEDINDQYNNIDVRKLDDTSFLLYNYKGFYLINRIMKKEIKLFNKDIYTLQLIYQKNNYLIVPDYNQNYFFNKMYVINILNGKVKEIHFEYDISFDSEFLGSYKNNIYLLDNKEKREYKINIKNNKIEEVEFQILKDNKMVKTDYKNVTKFEDNSPFKYEIINNKLYQIIDNVIIMISNLDIDIIIKNNQESVYYMSDENLYMYNNQYGEVLLMSNFEWNFKNTNMIYLYK